MRDWLEGQRWYWISVTARVTLFPWHWDLLRFERHSSYVQAKLGPVSVTVLW